MKLEIEATEARDSIIILAIDNLCKSAYATARNNGFHNNDDQPCRKGELIALMHSELSEALEAIREGEPPDNKLPKFTSVETELADVLIRVFDYAGTFNLRLGEALVAKMEYNADRPHKHGGKVF